MTNQITLIRDLVGLFVKEARRRLLTLGGMFSVVALLGLVIGLTIPKKWEASAVLIAEERNIIKPLMEGRAVTTASGDQTDIVTQVVLSRRILREVLAYGGWLTSKASPEDEERLINRIKGRIRINSLRDEMIKISYQDTDPRRTYKIANKLAEIYVREGAAAKERESRDAFEFISKRAKEYGEKLTEIHQKLLAYYNAQERGSTSVLNATDEEGAPLPPPRGITTEQLAALRVEEVTLTAQLTRKQATPPSGPELRQMEEQYRGRVLQLQSEVDRLIATYTDEYPEVKRAKRDLAIAKEELASAEKTRIDRENVRAAAVALDDDVSRAARARLEEVQRQITAATGVRRRPFRPASASATTNPVSRTEREMAGVGTDTTLSELVRRYEATRDVYQDLLKRRESARVSMDLDVERRGLTLRIQEAAEMPATASSMRLLYVTAIELIVAMLVPLGFLFAVVRLDPKVRSAWQIERLARVPVLATIPDAPPTRDKNRSRHQRFLVGMMVGGVFLLHAIVFVIKLKTSS